MRTVGARASDAACGVHPAVITADACDLSMFPDDTFSLIVDKGLIDALLCGSDSFTQVSAYMTHTYRVLAPGGVFIVVSHGVPASRTAYFKSKSFEWTVDHKK